MVGNSRQTRPSKHPLTSWFGGLLFEWEPATADGGV
jgi:hypothetical protein